MMVSIKDIAKAASVSHSTVSRALSDSPLISAETKARIRQLAQQMGYSPDYRARSLVKGRTQTVGVVVTTITDPFIAEVVQGIEDTAQQYGYTVILCNSQSDPEREVGAVDMLQSKRVDGLIVTSSRVGALYGEQLDRTGVPIVLVNNHNAQSGPYTFSVGVDNEHGGRMATDHLIQEGHRRIAYITGPNNHSDDLDRLSGYRQALYAAGIPYDLDLVVSGTGRVEGGRRALQVMRALEPLPTAAFCYNDMTAVGLIQAVRSMGLSVPVDLAVVGFDDVLFASVVEPLLTTIAQPKALMGQKAMEMVLTLLEVREPETEVLENTVLQGELVVRDSSVLRGRT